MGKSGDTELGPCGRQVSGRWWDACRAGDGQEHGDRTTQVVALLMYSTLSQGQPYRILRVWGRSKCLFFIFLRDKYIYSNSSISIYIYLSS